MTKVYCVIDVYRNGRFVSFDDYDNDGEFIRTIYMRFPEKFGEIMSVLYQCDEIKFDSGVNHIDYIPDYNPDYIFRISRRFDYEIEI